VQANLKASQLAYAGPPAYDPALNTANMASGTVAAHYNLPLTVFDDLGETHTLQLDFLKTANNTWQVEIVGRPAADVTAADGQVASGTLTFNGDGTLASVSAGLAAAIPVTWTSAAAASSITFNWGTAGALFGTPGATLIGRTDGLAQLDDTFHLVHYNQNGTPGGDPNTVSVDPDGYVSASYTDGSVHRLFKIPLVHFMEPQQLRELSGNVFTETERSGDASFRQVGDTGVGVISPGALEASNVDLGLQLADIIVAQRAYQANTKTITTSDEMLQKLDELLR
jgi:flagellar hook protein FlgE